MAKEPRPLAEMQERASDLCARLAPYCARIEVAGSVRRHKAYCADLELVAIPALVPAGLFGDRAESALYTHLKLSSDLVFTKGDNPEGRYYQLALPDGLQVDLFLTDVENWGLIYLIRTGSADFSQAVLARWKARQGLGREERGSVQGQLVNRHGDVVSTPEEVDVFRAIGCAVVLPQHRTDGTVLQTQRWP